MQATGTRLARVPRPFSLLTVAGAMSLVLLAAAVGCSSDVAKPRQTPDPYATLPAQKANSVEEFELPQGHLDTPSGMRAQSYGSSEGQLGDVRRALDLTRCYRRRLAGDLGWNRAASYCELKLAVLRDEIPRIGQPISAAL